MKKRTVILISIILVMSFVALVYYGLRRSRDIPMVVEEPKRVTLQVSYIDESIDLTKHISMDIWKDITPKEVELVYQVTVLPWPQKGLIPLITVKAFHNKKNIYFYVSWKDETEDNIIEINKFSDACSIMFPLEDDTQPASIMMGFMGTPNIWQWKASQDREYWFKQHPQTKAYSDFYYPFEDEELFVVSKDVPQSAVNDLMAIRVGTITPKEKQTVQGRGIWNKGTWQVVFKRSLKAVNPETDAAFNFGEKKHCAFAVWNGAKDDRGGRKSISDWVELAMKK